MKDVLESEDNLRVSKMLKQMTKFLKKEHVCEEDIEEIRDTFIKQCIFDKFIGFSDEHNYNAGIIFRKENRKKRARLTPCYDLDFAIDMFNSENDGVVSNYHFRQTDEKDEREAKKLRSMLKQFDGENLKRYIKSVLQNLDIDKAIELGEKRGDFTLSKMSREKYKNFFKNQIEELEQYIDNYKNNESIKKTDNER